METEEQHGQSVPLRLVEQDRKSVPRTSIKAAASFSTLTKSMAAGNTPPTITITTAWFWSKPLSNRFRASVSKTTVVPASSSLSMPRRKSSP